MFKFLEDSDLIDVTVAVKGQQTKFSTPDFEFS